MTKLLLGAAAAALLAGPALAQSANGTMDLSGLQPDVCTMTFVSSTGGGAMAPSTEDGTIGFNSTNALAPASSLTVNWTGMCNYNHKLGLRSLNGGMINGSVLTTVPAAGTFVTRLGYTANATWSTLATTLANELSFADSTASSPPAVAEGARTYQSIAVGPSQGNLQVVLAIPQGTLPLVAGSYSDAMIVQLGAII